jgi:hypothetical protein
LLPSSNALPLAESGGLLGTLLLSSNALPLAESGGLLGTLRLSSDALEAVKSGGITGMISFANITAVASGSSVDGKSIRTTSEEAAGDGVWLLGIDLIFTKSNARARRMDSAFACQ